MMSVCVSFSACYVCLYVCEFVKIMDPETPQFCPVYEYFLGHVCALQGRRRTGAFALPEGDRVQGAGAHDPRAAGAPFTSMELETRAGSPVERD